MDVLNELRAEAQKSQEMEQQRRSKHFAEYLTLVRGLGEADKNDKSRLSKLMKELGIDLPTLEDHLAVLHDFEAGTKALAEFEKAEAAAQAGRPELEKLHAEIVAIEERATPLRARLQALQLPAHVSGKLAAQARLLALGLVFGELFGMVVPEGQLTSDGWIEVERENRRRARSWGLAPARLDTEDFKHRDEQGSIR